MPDDVRSEGDPEADVGVGLRRLREALATMDAQLTAVLARAATGREGFITREWGFITPGGLGVPLGGNSRRWKKGWRASPPSSLNPPPTRFSGTTPWKCPSPRGCSALASASAWPDTRRCTPTLSKRYRNRSR